MKSASHIRLAVAIFLAGLLAGCAATQAVSPSTPCMLLTHSQTRQARAATVTFPPGVYAPSFQTQYGIYYRAPGHIITRALGITQTLAGGVFLPLKDAPDQRHAFWFDQPRSGDLIDTMTMQSAYRYPFAPPLEFEFVQGEAAYRDIPRSAPPPGM